MKGAAANLPSVHVLVIPRAIYGPKGTTHGIFEGHQVAALAMAGLQVGVIDAGVITARNWGQGLHRRGQEFFEGVPVIHANRRAVLPARWEGHVRSGRRRYRRFRRAFRRYVEAFGTPDVVHAHNLFAAGLIARRLFDDFGVPYVVTEHTSSYADSPIPHPDLAQHVIRAASAVIPVGSALVPQLEQVAGADLADRITVVPNVVDPVLLDTPLLPRGGRYTVAALGYLIPRKNYELLISAFAQAELPPDSVLSIGGSGPQLLHLQELANRLGIADRVEFLGQLDRRGVVSLLQRAHVFAHPSDLESFGVVLIEAMALGMPIVATNSGGPADIVRAGVGLLTPVGDVRELAAALADIYARRAELDAEEIREQCRRRFGPEAFARRMTEIYQTARR